MSDPSSVVSIRDDVIPEEVIPPDFTPSIFFSVVWPNGKATRTLGGFLTREDTLEEPEIYFKPLPSPEASATSYTLVMSDPDAPSRADPKYGQFRHWVITGLRYSQVEQPLAKTQPSTTPYRPPGPPPGSGVHRYTFLLFEEPASGFTVPQGAPEYGAALEERRCWNAVDFGEKYGLRPVGANWFLVRAVDL
ncbi:hypothetical protein DXG01_004407 [Tephrocybe rancida]|nr:hypothetical protein DXG01_004407 [Tephrocybe rancida]